MFNNMDIIDSRTIADFQKFTFSGHLRSHVYKVLNENIKLGHADYSCYWSLELVCSGLVHSMWNTFFLAAAQHINRGAPNVFLYLVKMYEKFAPYESQYSILQMVDIRNNHDARILISEVAASLALCRKYKLPVMQKIKPEHDFQQITVQENLKAPSANYARHLMKKDDSVDVYVPFNELVFCLRPETRDITRSLYWVSWILKYASQIKKNNKVDLLCAYRPNPYIDDKFARNIIWMIWDAVYDAARSSPQTGTITPYVDALFKLYCLRWNPGVLKERLPFLINAIVFICESTTLDIHYSVPHDITSVHTITANIPQWIHAIIQTQKTFS